MSPVITISFKHLNAANLKAIARRKQFVTTAGSAGTERYQLGIVQPVPRCDEVAGNTC